MSNFQGYYLKFGSTVFPNKYIDYDSIDATPNQRTEIDAWTDANNNLIRETYGKYRSKIEFNTVDELTLEEKIYLQGIMAAGLVNEKERKYNVTYWNDETNSYKTGDFYIPDIKYRIKEITGNTMIYGPYRIAIIEY